MASAPAEQAPVNQDYLLALIKALDEKFTLLLAEAEKRNGQRFDAQQTAVAAAMSASEKAITAAMAAAEKAVAKAEIAADKRLDGLNELRQMALDWKDEFARQTTVDLQIRGLVEKIDALQMLVAALDKRLGETKERGAGRNDIWGYLVGGIGIVATIVTLVVLLLK